MTPHDIQNWELYFFLFFKYTGPIFIDAGIFLCHRVASFFEDAWSVRDPHFLLSEADGRG